MITKEEFVALVCGNVTRRANRMMYQVNPNAATLTWSRESPLATETALLYDYVTTGEVKFDQQSLNRIELAGVDARCDGDPWWDGVVQLFIDAAYARIDLANERIVSNRGLTALARVIADKADSSTGPVSIGEAVAVLREEGVVGIRKVRL